MVGVKANLGSHSVVPVSPDRALAIDTVTVGLTTILLFDGEYVTGNTG